MDRLSTLQKKLTARPRQVMRIAGFRESAVLVPLILDKAGIDLLFTVRHDDLPTHAGQISFPGGKRDSTDIDLVQTAMREAREELGLEHALADQVNLIGLMDDVPTPSGFVITPVVSALDAGLEISPSAREVASVFHASLEALAEPSCYRSGGVHRFFGVEYVMHEYHYGEHRIWGATARVVHQLLSLVSAA